MTDADSRRRGVELEHGARPRDPSRTELPGDDEIDADFVQLLAAYDEALATGAAGSEQEPDLSLTVGASLVAELEEAKECLRLLEKVWPRQPAGSARIDAAARIWNVSTQTERFTLRAHVGAVRVVAFGPGGQALATGGSDGTVKFWDLRTGRMLLALDVGEGSVQSIAFSPDGRSMATAFASAVGEGRINLWDASDDDGTSESARPDGITTDRSKVPVADEFISRRGPVQARAMCVKTRPVCGRIGGRQRGMTISGRLVM